MLRSFNPKYVLFWRVRNIAFQRAVSTEQYQSALTVGLLCWPLNRMPCLRVVLQCRDSLQELAFSNRVQLVWVPGHCGIHGNEEADALAREGSSFAFVETEPCLPLAPSSVRRREREWLLKSWSLESVVSRDCG
jgi:hypothetical protein